jgi:NADPH:quinone reductase-like Zn-dependent oxidoreductase
MKTVQIPEYGGRDAIEYGEYPDPEVGADEVLVDDVLDLVWSGTFEPRIRETLPMSLAAEARRLLEDWEGFGKVVLVPDSEYDG